LRVEEGEPPVRDLHEMRHDLIREVVDDEEEEEDDDEIEQRIAEPLKTNMGGEDFFRGTNVFLSNNMMRH
jgi:hypothetical protein